MNRLVLFFTISLLFNCANHGQLKHITDLPKKLDENSGIVYFGGKTVWLVEDSGNNNSIYAVDFSGKLQKKFKVKNSKNKDWEDLASDENGNVYIGDFGNNANDRKSLIIYKLPNPLKEGGDKIASKRIKFRYPEQKDFPPKKDSRLYDTEAFFYHKNHLYLITKNRADPFTGEALIYRVPAKAGNYDATLMGSLTTCADISTCQITSADISPDGKTVVLLGYGKLWMLTDYPESEFEKGKLKEIDLGLRTQLESICFKDEKTLLLSDELQAWKGRNLYSYSLESY